MHGGTMGADTAKLILLQDLAGHAVRVGQTVAISEGTATLLKAYVSQVPDANSIKVNCYTSDTGCVAAGIATTASAIKVFVYGSEFAKGTDAMQRSGRRRVSNLTLTTLLFLKDKYAISGSDAAQIGWVEVTTGESGASGYLWYIKAEA